MKNFSFLNAALLGKVLTVVTLATVVTLTSCTAPDEPLTPVTQEPQESGPCAQVRLRVNGFSISQEDLPETRATAAASYSNVKIMTLAFFDGSGEVLSVTQDKSDASTYETFGEFTCSLPFGTYTMVVIGRDFRDGDAFTLTSPTEAAYTTEKARETFAKTQSVTISSTAPVDLGEITLDRIVSRLGIVSTDNCPANAAKIRTTFGAGNKNFSPSTGLALSDASRSELSNVSSSVGATIGISNFLFLASDEQTMTVTIEVLTSTDEVLFTKEITGVPFKRNRLTKLRGPLFTSGLTAAFTLSTDYLPDYTQDF